MQISVISTSVETKPGKTGSYQQLEVVFKNLTYSGKVESKKIMSFGAGAGAFKVLAEATIGSVWDVTVVKNAQGYLDWTSVSPSSGDITPVAAASTGAVAKSQPGQTRSTYETPEERAQRQILIVRQSSVSAAVATLSVGAKAVKPVDVIAVAKQYEDYVFGVKGVSDQRETGESGFEDLPDFDVPEVM